MTASERIRAAREAQRDYDTVTLILRLENLTPEQADKVQAALEPVARKLRGKLNRTELTNRGSLFLRRVKLV